MSDHPRHRHPRRAANAIIALAAAGSVLLAGCASAEPETGATFEPSDETVEVVFWTSAVEEVNQELADRFNQTRGEELGIHVTAEYQGQSS